MGERNRALNAKRKLQFGQATMLGITFVDRQERDGPPARWEFHLPSALAPKDRGWTCGWYKRRWECVEAALRAVGVVK